MGPSIAAVRRATQLFADPRVRARVLAWHEQDMPLLEMVEELGFTDLLEPELRDAIAQLKPEEVAIIRAVFVAEIDRAGDSMSASMPVHCGITDVTGPVVVTSEPIGDRVVAVVEPASGG